MRDLDVTALNPAVADHIEAVAASLRADTTSTYHEDVFRRRLPDRHWLEHWTTLPVHEQIAYVSLLGGAVRTCDDVECDPVASADYALDAVRPLLRGA